MTDTPHRSRNLIFLRFEKAVEELRKLAGWGEFHRLCGLEWLYFDDIEKLGRGRWAAVAFTVKPRVSCAPNFHRAKGEGSTPLNAVLNAYDKSGIVVPDIDGPIALMRNFMVPEEIGKEPLKTAASGCETDSEEITPENEYEDLIG